MPKIRVGEKALAHLSRGLYRSPASALRELVSNAWDARATEVRIDTNYPSFLQLVVTDNGEGMTIEQFTALMEGGIGNSGKRTNPQPSSSQRPVIGRIGIGMLGIAQICGNFTVTSKPRHGRGFRARIHLYDVLKERLDRDDPSLIHSKELEGATFEIVDVGQYEFEEFTPREWDQGTTIASDDLHTHFSTAFRDSLKFEAFRKPKTTWNGCLHTVSGVRSLQELGDYWRLLWELATASPVRYITAEAVPDGLISDEQKKLISCDFQVYIDGIDLAKPVWLRGNAGGYTSVPISGERRVFGRNLKYHGYIVVQEGAQLRPDELRGILIRIKNVAIGYYDQSMLDYRYNEGPRSRWVTGEIFVEEGLEDALNVDRDSFNRFHPEFKALQAHVHEVLHKQVFPAVYEKLKERSEERASLKTSGHEESFKDTVRAITDSRVRVRYDKGTDSESLPQASVVQKESSIDITLPAQDDMQTKRPYKLLASSILALFEIAAQERTRDKQRQKFTELLLDLLSRW